MDEGLAAARHTFGSRLVGGFAIGSLAHGGFAPAVSDVDLALILSHLNGGEKEEVSKINAAVVAGVGSALAGRLSVFWATWPDLEAGRIVGRLPIADLQDLVEAGVCLVGEDRRQRIAMPPAEVLHRRLVTEGAGFMLEKLATPERDARLRDPRLLVALGCREVTKAVLFPPRFLFTAHSGQAAGNEEAVRFIAETVTGPAHDLVLAAFGWRTEGVLSDDALPMLSSGLLPLYRLLLDVYQDKLRLSGEHDLAAGLRAWGQHLAAKI